VVNPEIFAREAILKIIKRYGARPTNALKLQLERLGLYQDQTGKVIDSLTGGNPLIEKTVHNSPYLIDPSYPKIDKVLKEAVKLNETFLKVQRSSKYSGRFNELLIYISLCKILDEHKEIFLYKLEPSGSRKFNGFTYKMDAFLILNGEFFAIEIKNKIDQTMITHKDLNGILNERGDTNPILINRFASRDVKREFLKQNGRVADILKLNILDCEETEEAKEASRKLGIFDSINWVPYITIDGEEFDGSNYRSRISEINHNKLIEAADQVPKNIHATLRGLIRLIFMASEFRRILRVEKRPNKKIDAIISKLLIQYSYEYLLSSKYPIDDRTLFEVSLRRITGHARKEIDSNREKAYSQLKEELYNLKEYGWVVKTGDKYIIRDAEIPDKILRL